MALLGGATGLATEVGDGAATEIDDGAALAAVGVLTLAVPSASFEQPSVAPTCAQSAQSARVRSGFLAWGARVGVRMAAEYQGTLVPSTGRPSALVPKMLGSAR